MYPMLSLNESALTECGFDSSQDSVCDARWRTRHMSQTVLTTAVTLATSQVEALVANSVTFASGSSSTVVYA
jgi:hypothetical protein